MYQKTCTRCKRDSYSSCYTEKWLCAYCNFDITHIKAYQPNHNSKISSIYKKLNEQKAKEAYQKTLFSIKTNKNVHESNS